MGGIATEMLSKKCTYRQDAKSCGPESVLLNAVEYCIMWTMVYFVVNVRST